MKCLLLGLIILIIIISIQAQLQSKLLTGACSIDNCPTLQGICKGNQCICSYGFVTAGDVNGGLQYCNYQTKSRFLACLLEFFFPFGIGHLYAENLLLAMIKFCFFMMFISMFCCTACCMTMKSEGCVKFISILFILNMILWFIMNIIDVCAYALGYYADGHGIIMQ